MEHTVFDLGRFPGAGRARVGSTQSGFPGNSRRSSFSQFGLGYGAGIDYVTTPFSYGSVGAAGYGGFGGVEVSPYLPYGLSNDQAGGYLNRPRGLAC